MENSRSLAHSSPGEVIPLSTISRAHPAKTSGSIQARIAAAERRSGRTEGSVKLVAVTKKWPAELIRPLVAAGAVDLGENYPQELWRKVEMLANSRNACAGISSATSRPTRPNEPCRWYA